MIRYDVIRVKAGPRAGLWFKSRDDLDRFLGHPAVTASTPPHNFGLPLRVASDKEWTVLQAGIVIPPAQMKRTHHDGH